MKKLEAITLALLLGAAYTRGRKAGKVEGELATVKKSKKASEKTQIDWETVGTIAQTVSEKIEKYFESNPKTADTPVEETEKENSVEETEKEEDTGDLIIENYMVCMRSEPPFNIGEAYHMIVKNDKNYVLCGTKKYRLYTKDAVLFSTTNGAWFVVNREA